MKSKESYENEIRSHLPAIYARIGEKYKERIEKAVSCAAEDLATNHGKKSTLSFVKGEKEELVGDFFYVESYFSLYDEHELDNEKWQYFCFLGGALVVECDDELFEREDHVITNIYVKFENNLLP